MSLFMAHSFAKAIIVATAITHEITEFNKETARSAKYSLNLDIPVEILLFIARQAISVPVNIMQKIAIAKGITYKSPYKHWITNRLSINLGLLNMYDT